MAKLVAYRMELQPRHGQSTGEMVDEICELFSEFVVKHFRRHGVEIFPLHFDGKPDCLDKDNRLVATRSDFEQHTLATVDWEVIPEQGSDHIWRVSFACSCDKRSVEIQYHGQLDLSTLLVTPGRKKMKIDTGLLNPDEFLSKVLGQWVATIDGWPIPIAVCLLKVNNVKAFVEDTLLNPKRVLPVIVLAADGRFKATPSSMQDLQRRLLGVAQVAALMNKQATESLQAELGPERACSIGVLRIYYPMFTRECPPRNHPLFRAEDLGESAKDFETFLHRESMKFLVQRSPDGPLTKAARNAVAAEMVKLVDRFQTLQSHVVTVEDKLRSTERQRDRVKDERDELRHSLRSVESKLSERNRKLGNWSDELAAMRAKYETCARELVTRGEEHQIAIGRVHEQNQVIAELENRFQLLRDEIRAGRSAPGDAGETAEELQRAWQENDRTLTDLEAARHEIARLQGELRICKENLELIAANPTGIRRLPDDIPSTANAQAPPTTVLEALHLASERHADLVEIWDDAWSSAKKSHYPGPTRVMEALNAIAEIGRSLFDATQYGHSIGPLEQAFRAKVPFKYASGESQITMAMYGKERTFQGPNQRREIQRHLTLGGGGNCLQVYFDFDEVQRRVIIAYCGQHLSHYRQSS